MFSCFVAPTAFISILLPSVISGIAATVTAAAAVAGAAAQTCHPVVMYSPVAVPKVLPGFPLQPTLTNNEVQLLGLILSLCNSHLHFPLRIHVRCCCCRYYYKYCYFYYRFHCSCFALLLQLLFGCKLKFIAIVLFMLQYIQIYINNFCISSNWCCCFRFVRYYILRINYAFL